MPTKPPSLLCGARTRRGTYCKAPGNGQGGRCKLHGGKSTGPRTVEGRARIADANRRRAAAWRAWIEANDASLLAYGRARARSRRRRNA
jgi:hypothetical protein